ncbi:MAG: hypothetical protein AABY00_02060 [Nanoarchaeota archaeon]
MSLETKTESEQPTSKWLEARVRVNIYSGAILGGMLPTVATRYTIFQGDHSLIAWTGAMVFTTCSLLTVTGLVAGLGTGMLCASDLLRDYVRKRNKPQSSQESPYNL